MPLGWALYLPREWCDDEPRRRKAKIPEDVTFQTKPELAAGLIEQAGHWEIPAAPVLGDEAYGKNTALRTRLDGCGVEYVPSINADARVYRSSTVFSAPDRKPGSRGPAPSAVVADRDPVTIAQIAASLEDEDFQTLTFRTLDDEDLTSRFAMVRVICAHPVERDSQPPREEWLIIEWPDGAEQPIDYWISNLPADTEPERLARLARLRWVIELDYRQLKGELGPDHYEGLQLPGVPSPLRDRDRRAWVLDVGAIRPKSPAADLTLPQAVLLFRPLLRCWTGRCMICRQPVDTDTLDLFWLPQQE